MIDTTRPIKRVQELRVLEQGDVPFRRLQIIHLKFPELDPEALQFAFRILSNRQPWHENEGGVATGGRDLAENDIPLSPSSEILKAKLKEPTAAQERQVIKALISQVTYLRGQLRSLHPSTLEKLVFPHFSSVGGPLIDELASVLMHLRDGLKAGYEKLHGKDSRRDHRPLTRFVFTVANEVERAGLEVSAKPSGVLQNVVGIMLEDTPFAKDLESSTRKALKGWVSTSVRQEAPSLLSPGVSGRE